MFDGQLGYLDYALAGTALADDVTGAEAWRINADEPSLHRLRHVFKLPAQDALFAPDPYRSSDHDPVVVGLDLTPPDTTPPTIERDRRPGIRLPAERQGAHGDDRRRRRRRLRGRHRRAGLGSSPPATRRPSIRELTDTTFSVMAATGAIYTFTYTATDAAGNTATATTTVRVRK